MSNHHSLVYTIEFFSYWHIGSGLSIAGDVDAAVLKDRNNLPYIPGKALKGLLREAAEQLAELENNTEHKELINKIFGEETTKAKTEEETELSPEQNALDETQGQAGQAFFYNAEINPNNLLNEASQVLYDRLSATRIDDKGLAEKNSLRKMEVSIPLKLYSKITGLNEAQKTFLTNCLKWVKRMGLQRHRGLGRCQFKDLN